MDLKIDLLNQIEMLLQIHFIYMAFAEEPLVANVGQSIPATAR